MTHELETAVIAFPAEHSGRVNRTLERLGDPGGASFRHAREALDKDAQIHFMSLVVVPAIEGERLAHLVVEISADRGGKSACARVAGAIPAVLGDVLAATGLPPRPKGRLLEVLEEGRVSIGTSLFSKAGLVFSGTPGMSVKRIRDEWRLATRIRELLDDPACKGSASQKLESVRDAIFADDRFKWAFVAEPMPLRGEEKRWWSVVRPVANAAFRDFLWPLIPAPVLVFLHARLVDLCELDSALWRFVLAGLIELVLLGLAVGVGYRSLRRQEKEDVPIDREPGEREMVEIQDHENRPGYAQNHLAGISFVKKGWVRYVTLRLALWLVGELGARVSRPGFINKIGTIHFARWLKLPGTDRLVFLSNYDGSWQSYLEDFIARLRSGLSSVWSNTRNFPKTDNLVAGGAGDAARFKRWARMQQEPTRFWYSAYPELTGDRIRAHAEIRHGLAAATSEDDAARWLSQIGYARREALETAEIPTLVFGGLSRLRFSHCLVVGFGDGQGARKWLEAVEGDICYGDRVPDSVALVVAFTSGGLRKLGVGERSMATFPMAFQQGMPSRKRELGDEPGEWTWGANGDADALVVLYAKSDGELNAQVDRRIAELAALGHATRRIEVRALEDPVFEPFGFRDGISQPVLRGSLRWSREGESMNTIAPGEIVLGYPDGLDLVPPTPQLKGRDIGRNGTFLVVRQLEQDTAAFRKYVGDKARKLHCKPPDPRLPDCEDAAELATWIAAKMVGRWPDGSSLVRNPHRPGGFTKDPDNDFRFGLEDPDGLRCPLGAHIRRANPRDSFEPGSRVQMSISNRHRILRVGRVFEPEKGKDPGLLFMCINADIERQFEFLQQSWILGPGFHGLHGEVDPVVGYGSYAGAMTIQTTQGPVRLEGLAKFVTTRGGGYFFMPPRSTVRILARGC